MISDSLLKYVARHLEVAERITVFEKSHPIKTVKCVAFDQLRAVVQGQASQQLAGRRTQPQRVWQGRKLIGEPSVSQRRVGSTSGELAAGLGQRVA